MTLENDKQQGGITSATGSEVIKKRRSVTQMIINHLKQVDTLVIQLVKKWTRKDKFYMVRYGFFYAIIAMIVEEIIVLLNYNLFSLLVIYFVFWGVTCTIEFLSELKKNCFGLALKKSLKPFAKTTYLYLKWSVLGSCILTILALWIACSEKWPEQIPVIKELATRQIQFVNEFLAVIMR